MIEVMGKSIFLVSGFCFLLNSLACAGSPPVNFSREILPILSQNCFQCHGPDQQARKAKLRLDTKEGAMAVIVPGKSSESELVVRINAEPEKRMPPLKTKKSLTAEQKELLRRWIDEGATWSKHWAYEAPRRPSLPVIKNAGWPRNPIDYFVLARLEREGLKPAAEASKETLIRRVTFDLTGLPPTIEEIDAFLRDKSADAYEKVVDRLLASERYGERMAADWLDDARYADTNGYQNDFARSMWPWRDWVIDAYNRNLPFDRFVTEQLGGDLLPNPTVPQRVATGFNRNNRTVTEAGSIDEEWRIENGVDRVETTTTVFLGLTMGCARCHDHKYDPISQKEFYQFLGFFNSINEKGVYTEQPGNVPPLLSLPSPEDRLRVQELDRAIALADSVVTEEEKRLPPRQKEWELRELLTPTSATLQDSAVRFALDSQWPQDELARTYRERFATELLKARQAAAKRRQEKSEYEKRIPSVMIMEDLPKPRDTFVLKRGRYDMPDQNQKVDPGVPACLPSMPPGAARNRLGLARWLIDPANPLTARVAVNRFWQRLFGQGLVKTTENFGVQGEPPSHPELLDWLATEFARLGWDMKAMQKLIVMSAAYRQSSQTTPDLVRRDPENRLLAHGPRFRLSAEMVRDNALAVSGLLAEKIGGPSVKPYQPAGLWEELAGGAGEGPYVQDKGSGLYRRSLYVYRKRTVPHPLMTTFDAPSREVCLVKRSRTNTPLQALELLNDATYVEAARRLAEAMLTAGGDSAEQRLILAFRRATARQPDRAELKVLSRGLERYRQSFQKDPEAARKLVHQGNSPVNEKLDPIELATYTSVAGIILNMDETITKE